MGNFNFNLVKDELSLPAWLAIGALGQAGVTLFAPPKYFLVPACMVLGTLAINFSVQYLGFYRNKFVEQARLGRVSVTFPEEDGSRPEKGMGSKPVTMFVVGIRSNHPIGRLLPTYRKLNDYLDRMYQDAIDNRETNGYLGRTPDLVPAEFSQNNTLLSISYWKSLEDLEAWSRRPIHLQGLKFLDYEVNKSGRPHDLGVMHEVIVSPAGHWEGIYSNVNPFGMGSTMWPTPNGKGVRDPFIESNPKVINTMWGRMGNKLKAAENEKITMELMAAL